MSSLAWYRVLELAYSRGAVAEHPHRLARFLSQQELDQRTGRVVGQWGTGRTDGGMTLAARYAENYGIGEDRFWADLLRLRRAGFAERVVAPAPGRRAVYALCLRTDAIPGDLPEDLTQQLRVWDLPDADPDEHADSWKGRLSSLSVLGSLDVEPVAVEPQDVATLAAAARWEHPADSTAAAVAESLRETSKRLSAEERPVAASWAVAERDRAEALAARMAGRGKTSPSYETVTSPSVWASTTGSSWLSTVEGMGQAKRRASPATEVSGLDRFGADLRSSAERVLKRAWHAWRAELGRGKVLLTPGHWDDQGQWHKPDAWTDLQRATCIALRRSSEAELIELLSSGMTGVEDPSRVAGYRLWKLINERRHTHEHRPTVAVAVSATVAAYDAGDDAAARLREQEARRISAARRAAELNARWGLDRHRAEDDDQAEEPESPATSPGLGGHAADRLSAARAAIAAARGNRRRP